MVEDGDGVVRYHFGCDGHSAECNGAPCRSLRLFLPHLAARLLPGRTRARRTSCASTRSGFDTVELNTTGYRLPAEDQFARWAEQTPHGFRFAPKLTRATAPGTRSSHLLRAARRARRPARTGPRARSRAARDEGLLAFLLGSLDPALRFAFDFRHESWAGVEERLDEAGVAS